MLRLSKILMLFGVFCMFLTGFLYWQRTTPRRLEFKSEQLAAGVSHPDSEKGIQPKVLVIDDLNIILAIYPTVIENGRWQASDKGVSYLATSPFPGDEGNAIFYGHNWKNMLGPLVHARPGQNLEIVYSDGSIKKFKVSYTQTVTPDQTQILADSTDRRITLYTCTGFLDTKRFVVTALYEEGPDALSGF